MPLWAGRSFSISGTSMSSPRSGESHVQLPYDILCLVISSVAQINPKGLAILSLVSKAFYEEVERWRWRSLRLHIPKANFHFLKGMFRTIGQGNRPSRILDLRIHVTAWLPPSSREAFAAEVHGLLVQCTNLQALSIEFSKPDVVDDMVSASFLKNASLFSFQLVELAYHDEDCREIWELLASQRKIQRLVLPNLYDENGNARILLPPEALPELRVVIARAPILQAVVPGRPVQHIFFATKPQTGLPALYRAITSSKCAMTSVSVVITSYIDLRELLQSLQLYTPLLRYLCVSFMQARGLYAPGTLPVLLKEFEHLECIRWRDCVTGSALISSAWHPSSYAGPSLCTVQHEYGDSGSDCTAAVRESEGVWERDPKDQTTWTLRRSYLITPRLPTSNSLDPLALDYM